MIAKFLAGVVAAAAIISSAFAQTTAAPMTQRPGYLFVMATTTDREALGKYARSLPAIYDKYQGTYLASGGVGGAVRVLEGDFKFQSIILARFPTFEGPNAFWWSPEYTQAKQMRKGAGIFNVVKLKGQPGDLTVPAGKPAYLISIADIKDRDKLKPYVDVAGPLVKAAGAEFISTGGRKDIELMEGEFDNFTVNILRFPSLEGLRAFYNDPAYQKVIPIRQSAGDYIVLEVDGFQPRH